MTAATAVPAKVERGRKHSAWLALTLLLFCAAAVMRIHNAYGLFIDHGFDEPFNWTYVADLTQSWEIPKPDKHWSAARPPLFFFSAGAVARVAGPAKAPAMHAIRLASSAFGLLALAIAAAWIFRNSARDAKRLALAAGLLCFVPAHIYVSAMVNEEISVASWITLALVLALIEQKSAHSGSWSWARVVAIGIAGGLAFLTKLTGCLVVIAIAFSFALDGWRRGSLRPALTRAALLSVIALVVGGWFYARSLYLYGYLYPHSLDSHSIMLSMPPGARGLLDYFWISPAAFSDTRVNSPALLHSVWGGTYVTWWFDGQRHFVPRNDSAVDRMGLAILLLGLLPSAAAVAGALRGFARARREAGTPDALMLSLVAIMLAGYALYTWQNPWFAVIKATYLLGLLLPFAYWASGQLCQWMQHSRGVSLLLSANLLALLLCITAAFSFGTPLWEMTLGVHMPGLPWLPDQP